ncbi:MAG: 16S rRNA (cytidine(1402)-2'-O)-methyltransferase [Minisyncoccia bacterium]
MSEFYVVGTPIGNMEDITLRAIRILSEVDFILCEDTRVTRNILKKYSISKPTISYHTQSKLSKIDEIIFMLKEGKNLALVSDAGTPTISDPGSLLISRILAESPDTKIITIPGPSALVSALSVSGFPSSDFLFLGFLPHKKGRETLFKEIASSERTVVFYESPHRIMKTLESFKKFIPDRKIMIARELTKIFEETVFGLPEEVERYFLNNSDKVRGEFVVIVSPKK